jgi:hypothetical protein
VPGQLSTLSGLGALRHLDLQVVGIHEVLTRHAESRRRDLLDRAPTRVSVRVGNVPRRILAAFARIRLAAQPVHGDGQRFVRLAADRTVGHRTRGEPLDDAGRRFDLLDRNRLGRHLELEQATQRRTLARLLVHRLGVFLVNLVLAAARRVLQLVDRIGIEEVVLAIAAPLVLAAFVEIALGDRAQRERQFVARAYFLGDRLDAHAANARRRPREIAIDEVFRQADRLEDLRAAIALQRRDAHLRHHLQHALVQGFYVVFDRFLVCQPGQHVPANHVAERLERQVRVHGACAVADEQRQVMHLARLAGLDDERGAIARALAHEVMMDAGGRQQARNRRELHVHAAIGQDDDRVALLDRFAVRRCKSSSARDSPVPPESASKSICRVIDLKPRSSMWRSLASSSLFTMADLTLI